MPKTYTTIPTYTAGQILTAASMNNIGTTLNNVVVRPMASAYTNGTQTLTSGTWTILTNFGAEDFDTDAMHDNTTNNGRITFKTAGVYLVTLNIGWAANATGDREAGLIFSPLSTTVPFWTSGGYGSMNASNVASQSVTAVVNAAVNDYVIAAAYQSSGGALNVLARAAYTAGTFSAVWMGNTA